MMAGQSNALSNLFSGADDDSNVQRVPVLKLRGKTLIFANTIYQISNIAVLQVIDLTTVKTLPPYIWIMGGIGVLLALTQSRNGTLLIIGIALAALAGYLYYQFQQTKVNERYGLKIVTSAGTIGSAVLVNSDLNFLKQVAVTINNLMNSETEVGEITFNFDQRQIEVGTMTNSNLVAGSVTGDVVSNV